MVQLYGRSRGEFLVNTVTEGSQTAPLIARLASGGFVLVWTDASDSGGNDFLADVKAQIYDSAGAKVGGEILVNSSTAYWSSPEGLAALPNGGFIVTYNTGQVTAQMFDAAGAKTGGEIVVTALDPAVPADRQANVNSRVAVLDSGEIVITWDKRVQFDVDVYAQVLTPQGVKSGAEFRVNPFANGHQQVSTVTALASGGFVVTWDDGLEYEGGLRGQVYDANRVPVGSSFRVNTLVDGSQENAALTALPGGGFAAVWVSDPYDGSGPSIRGQIFTDAGVKVGPEFLVNTIDEGLQATPRIDALAGGGFVVTWYDQSRQGGDESHSAIMAQIFDSAGARVGTQFLVNSETRGIQAMPAVAGLASGGFAIAWTSETGGNDIKAQIFAPIAGGPTDIALSPAAVLETTISNYAAATLSSNGGINGASTYTLLADSTGGGFRIEGNRLVVADNRRLDHETAPTASLTVRVTDANGNSFDEVLSVAIADSAIEDRYSAGPDFTADTFAAGGQLKAAIGALASGGYVMAWTDPAGDGSGSAVRAQRFDSAGVKVGVEIEVNTAAAGDQISPATAGLASGGFVVVWEDPSHEGGDSSGSSIKGQRFDSAGAKVGGEFLVNAITASNQSEPAVAALSSGGFVVTWTDYSDSTASDFGQGDVRAQVYDAAGAKAGGEILVNTTTFSGQTAPAVAALTSGGFVVTWVETQTGAVVLQRFGPAGDKIGGEVQVGTSAAFADGPAVAALASGGFVIGWSGDGSALGDSSEISVQAQIFDSAGARSGSVFLVNTETESSQFAPAVNGLPSGGFVISWQDNSLSNWYDSYSIHGQIFDGAGGRIGGEFIVPAGAEGTQYAPVSTTLSSGSFVVGWTESGAESAVEGRVFSLIQADTSGDDTLVGDSNANLLDGGGGNDQIYGNGGNDDLRGGTGSDWLYVSGTGTALADGGADFDRLTVDYGGGTAPVSMIFPVADPNGGLKGTISDGNGRRVDYSSINVLHIVTGSGNDVIYGGENGSSASLGGGDDRFWGAGGHATADGGAGVDGISADLRLSAGAIAWNLQTNSFSGPNGSYTNFEYFLEIFTGSAADTVVTTSAALNDIVQLGGGDDVATVVNGWDMVNGQYGNDLLIIDYSGATAAVVTIGGFLTAEFDMGGASGRIGDGAGRRVDFFAIDRFDIRTGSGDDAIVLGTGSLVTDDIVSLGGGSDSVDLGRGVDRGDGGAGVDSLAADLSLAAGPVSINLVANTFSGPAGLSFVNFEYFGGSGLRTGAGNDVVVTGQLARGDTVALGSGNDSATVHDGLDSVDGQAGSDLLIVDYGAATAAVTTTGGSGGITTGTDGSGAKGQISDGGTRRIDFDNMERFDVRTGAGNDNIATAGGNDEIRTGGGADILAGGGGDDLLDGGTGIDSMRGGTGNDTYVVDDAGDVVEENAGEGSDAVRTALAVYSLAALPHIEALVGTSATGQTLTGNAASNRIDGGAGNDIFHLWVGGGHDTVLGNGGNDTFFFGAALAFGDTIRGGAGSDIVVIQGNYAAGLTLASNVSEIEGISILGGNNTNFGEPGTNLYDYVLTTHDANFAAGVQARVNGSALLAGEDFTFNGSAETDASYVVYGGKGKDTLTGGLGNDIFFYAEERFASGDTVNGGAGYDGMFLRGNYTIDFNAPGYTGLFTNIENLTLTSATDERYARGGGTEFDYNLTLSNAIVGAGQELTVSGALLMVTETMILDGSQETDGRLRLFGGKGADTLKGGGQADLIHGALGADILSGGGGADAFRFQNVLESNAPSRDHIIDFTPGTDKIELDRIDARTNLAGDQAFTWIGSSAFSGVAGQLRAFQSGAQWIVQGDINGDGFADLVIALTLQGPTPLGAGDFIL